MGRGAPEPGRRVATMRWSARAPDPYVTRAAASPEASTYTAPPGSP
jgi:hypothetical protein